MKICWDMLEGVYLTRKNTFRKGNVIYIYKDSCIRCEDPYLTRNSAQSEFCSFPCAQSGENSYRYGKHHNSEFIKTLSKKMSGRLNPNYKGGVSEAGLVTYDSYKNTLGPYENVRKQKDTEVLEVMCAYCGRWYTPTNKSVNGRIRATMRLNGGECHLYCSENCKQSCPTYRQAKYPKGFKHTTSREVNSLVRQMVFERDNWTCQICGKTIKEAPLHVHHMDPATQNPMFQNDMDGCITLCMHCHKMAHKQHGCRYIDLRCKQPFITKDLDYPRDTHD